MNIIFIFAFVISHNIIKDLFIKYILVPKIIKEMEIHKWIESEAAGHDLGDAALKDWILKHAVEFRKHWEEEHKNDKN